MNHNRVARIPIPSHAIGDLLGGYEAIRNGLAISVSTNFPKDGIVIGAQYDIACRELVLLVQSESFAEVEPGCEISILHLICRQTAVRVAVLEDD